MKSMLRTVETSDGVIYDCLMFVCPGCLEMSNGHGSGVHMLPVNTDKVSPAWVFDGNLVEPTLSPSILTGRDSPNICHSYLRNGVFQFLGDCTHSLVGQYIHIPDLPDWVIEEKK